jgi:hypothetical protein
MDNFDNLLLSSESVTRLDSIAHKVRDEIKNRALRKIQKEGRRRLEVEDVDAVAKAVLGELKEKLDDLGK